jgi:hypothetical protein
MYEHDSPVVKLTGTRGRLITVTTVVRQMNSYRRGGARLVVQLWRTQPTLFVLVGY